MNILQPLSREQRPQPCALPGPHRGSLSRIVQLLARSALTALWPFLAVYPAVAIALSFYLGDL